MSVYSQVSEGIRVLSQRLPDLLQARIEEIAPSVPWTAVLKEVDAKKGRVRPQSDAYAANDLQVQLRMLTERLAGLGFPFDDESRIVSTLAAELRGVRNLWAHTHEFNALEGFRASDSKVRLLEHFGDQHGAVKLERLRNKLLPNLLEELDLGDRLEDLGLAPRTAASSLSAPSAETPTEAPADDSQRRVEAAATRSTVQRNYTETGSTQGLLGQDRVPFEAWIPAQLGTPDMLESFKRKQTRELVQAAAEEAIDAEGPVHEDRLVKFILTAFGRKRASSTLEQQIKRQLQNLVKSNGCHRDQDSFYWPAHTHPQEWMEFRPSPDTPARKFEEISAKEMRNAAREIQEYTEEVLSETELKRAVVRVFGFKKIMRRYEARLNPAVAGLSSPAMQ
ncbi:DUF3320 domain-containing protein [Nesterenkonia cremea]|uniref:Swt1-like HEPN domain-containing protein n=1 Tax=Nesterenkonia cremea TaxID=1882340 RepID=A0A917EMN7_9MICC|nr:DUF3320 domain-containing protein [Nesterenkonia cremea]GGE63608.1 hypothetical protein GCM10011401_08390 [Nesterenkonia cremea]